MYRSLLLSLFLFAISWPKKRSNGIHQVIDHSHFGISHSKCRCASCVSWRRRLWPQCRGRENRICLPCHKPGVWAHLNQTLSQSLIVHSDSGSGSLRDAVSAANRIVVFDVGGTINVTSRIVLSKNIYIAGQTAPGGVSSLSFGAGNPHPATRISCNLLTLHRESQSMAMGFRGPMLTMLSFGTSEFAWVKEVIPAKVPFSLSLNKSKSNVCRRHHYCGWQ